MSTQSYYLTELENSANVCDHSAPLIVNCAGIVDEKIAFSNCFARHDFYFLYLIRGTLHTPSGTLVPGSIIIFKPEFLYSYKSEGETAYLWVHFTGSRAAALISENSLKYADIINIGVHRTITERFENLFQEFVINDSRSPEMRTAILKEIIILSGRYKNENSFKKVPFKSIEYINKNYTKNISVNYLANLEDMSLTRFRTLFKKHTMHSPLDYITLKRISAACRMLVQSEGSISEVAAASGYDDPYYFSRIFKKKIGISPKQYRKEMRPG